MIRVNLIPKEYIQKEKKREVAMLAGGAAGIVAMIVIGISLSFVFKAQNLKKQAMNLESQVSELEQIASQVDALQSTKNSITSKIDAVKKLITERFTYPKLMQGLASILSPQIWYSNVVASPEAGGNKFNMNISAMATSIDGVIEWIEKLESNPAISEVDIGALSGVSSGKIIPINVKFEYKP
ncbi:PilN domain-containing protein [Elusimicrobiota bacterium]